MDVRRIRPLVPPPYPRRNRYTPVVDANSISFASVFGQSLLIPLHLLFLANPLHWVSLGFWRTLDVPALRNGI